VGDCMDIIMNMEKPVNYGPEKTMVTSVNDIADLKSKYYIRLLTDDKPGVLHEISGILSSYGISIESMTQKQKDVDEGIPIFMVTHTALERNMRDAIYKIDNLDCVKDKTLFIRVL
jgi:homoserine dehydrogenase